MIMYISKMPQGVSEPESMEPMTSASQAFGVLKEFQNLSREHFWALFLDGRRRLIAPPYCVSIGTITQTLVHPREVFREAILKGACCIIVAHNHPSGDPTPSSDDYIITDRLVQAGSLIG